MGETLIHNFGVLPDFVTIWNGGPTRSAIETRVRFRLELWRAQTHFELRHDRQTLALPAPDAAQSLRLMWMHPAKDSGFSELRVSCKTVRFGPLLFSGRYDDLDWLRAVAQKLGQLTDIAWTETDMGGDS